MRAGREGVTALRSRSGRQALVLVHFRATDLSALEEPVDRLRDLREPGLDLRFGGYAVGEIELNRVAREELIKAELIAVPLLALLMVLIFRGLVAAAIPLVIGGVAMLGTYAGLQLVGRLMDLSVFALNLAVLLALGLAVDYSLLLVSRYREEAAERGPGVEGGARDAGDGGRAVAFSGVAVAAACAPLVIFAQSFVYSMGVAGVLVAALAASVALLVTVPLLVLFGARIAPRAAPAPGRTPWYRFAHWVMRHPGNRAAIGVLLLIAAAAPVLEARWTFPTALRRRGGRRPARWRTRRGASSSRSFAAPVSVVVAPGQGPAGVPLASRRSSTSSTGSPWRRRSRRPLAARWASRSCSRSLPSPRRARRPSARSGRCRRSRSSAGGRRSSST